MTIHTHSDIQVVKVHSHPDCHAPTKNVNKWVNYDGSNTRAHFDSFGKELRVRGQQANEASTHDRGHHKKRADMRSNCEKLVLNFEPLQVIQLDLRVSHYCLDNYTVCRWLKY